MNIESLIHSLSHSPLSAIQWNYLWLTEWMRVRFIGCVFLCTVNSVACSLFKCIYTDKCEPPWFSYTLSLLLCVFLFTFCRVCVFVFLVFMLLISLIHTRLNIFFALSLPLFFLLHQFNGTATYITIASHLLAVYYTYTNIVHWIDGVYWCRLLCRLVRDSGGIMCWALCRCHFESAMTMKMGSMYRPACGLERERERAAEK